MTLYHSLTDGGKFDYVEVNELRLNKRIIINSAIFLDDRKYLLIFNITLSRTCLHGIRSSGELSASPQAGHVFVSDSIKESLAHSSHIAQAQEGIIIAS